MTIEFIYTFENQPQEFIQCTADYSVLQDKNSFIQFALDTLDTQPDDLIKISCCVTVLGNTVWPDWFIECNGKIWQDDIIDYLYQL